MASTQKNAQYFPLSGKCKLKPQDTTLYAKRAKRLRRSKHHLLRDVAQLGLHIQLQVASNKVTFI